MTLTRYPLTRYPRVIPASFRAPMAIVVIGGLITSTFLSLLVIPVFFNNVDDAITWVRTRRRPRAAQAEHGLLG